MVTIDIEGAVATVSLSRAEKSNALNAALVGELRDALAKLDKNPKIRVAVLTGAGKHFSAGADIEELDGQSAEDMYFNDPVLTGREDVARFRKPLIAAVNGLAIGGGFEIALMCDVIVASTSAKFGCPEVQLGTLPGAGATQRLVKALGYYRAAPLILTGKPVSANQGHQIGFVSQCVEGDALPEAQAFAAKMARAPLHSLMLCKEAMGQALEMSLHQGLRFEKRLFHGSVGSEALNSGIDAFKAKTLG